MQESPSWKRSFSVSISKSSKKPVAPLQRSINEKRARIQAAKQLDSIPTPGILQANIADLKRQAPETPLDGILQPLQQVASHTAPCWCDPSQAIAQQHDGWQYPGTSMSGTSEMFLKPARSAGMEGDGNEIETSLRENNCTSSI